MLFVNFASKYYSLLPFYPLLRCLLYAERERGRILLEWEARDLLKTLENMDSNHSSVASLNCGSRFGLYF